MERWSAQRDIGNVYQNRVCCSYTAWFPSEFQRHDAPSHNILLLWVSKWRQEGSVKESKPQGRPFTASTSDNVEWVRDSMLRSLCRSAWWPALALRLNECGVCRILHMDLHHHPNQIQVEQELSAWDKSSGLCFRVGSFLISGTSPGPSARLTLQ